MRYSIPQFQKDKKLIGYEYRYFCDECGKEIFDIDGEAALIDGKLLCFQCCNKTLEEEEIICE